MTICMRRIRLALPLALILIVANSAFGDDRHLQVADYLEVEQVADAQVSPDGDRIVYTRRWADQKSDRISSALWMMEADGSGHRYLTSGSNARWSPNGDRILFISKGDNDKPQLFVRWMDDGGAESQVTRVEITPSSPKWSPDGQQIAFVAIVPAENAWSIDLPDAPEGADWSKAPRILDRIHYRQDRVGFTDPGFSHLFVVPASSGTARQLTSGDWNVGAQFDGLFSGASLDWAPDSQTLVFDGWMDSDGDDIYRRSHVYSIDVDNADISQLTQEMGNWTSPVFSSDGEQIAYMGHPVSDVSYEMPRIHLMNNDGSSARQLSDDFDRPPSTLHWASNNRGLYFSAPIDGYINVFYMAINGDVREVTSGKQTVALNSLTANSSTGVGVIASYYAPGDIHSFALNGRGTPMQLTAVNDDLLAGKTLGNHEEIWYEASDGNRVHGWIVKPPNFDPEKKYPLLMEIHGGPFGMYAGRFNFQYQVFASNGFVVLYTNPRGSTGYGEAFSQAIDHAYPSVDYLDLMGGVDATIAAGYVDEKRMYVGGCSGGGVLSSWVIGHTDRFAAAAVRCPVSNWMSMLGTTDIPNFTQAFFQKPFWEDPSDWLRHSPLMYVGNVKTPTIVMTGEQDRRTPMSQSEEYYAALKIVGVPAKLLRFNDQYHGTGSKPSNYMRTILYMMSWYNQYTLDGEVDSADE